METKKKIKRKIVGSVLTSKENSKEFYIKLSEDVVLTKGSYLRLESKQQQLESLDAAITGGKLSGEMADSIRERLTKIPDFVKFQVIQLQS